MLSTNAHKKVQNVRENVRAYVNKLKKTIRGIQTTTIYSISCVNPMLLCLLPPLRLPCAGPSARGARIPTYF